MTDTKTCSKCGETKPLDQFYKNKSKRDGVTSSCKECYRAYRVANRDRIAARKRAYYEANREEVTARVRRYREANPRKVAASKHAWYSANRDEILARRRAYRSANLDEIRAAHRDYYRRNRDKFRAYYAENPHVHWVSLYRRRSRKLGLDEVVEDFTRGDVIKRYGDSCAYCGGAFEHLDHFIPVKAGGTHTLENVRPSCAACNVSKSDLSPDEWLAEQAELDDLTEDELEAAIDAEIDRWTN